MEIIELQSEKGAVDMNRVFILQRALVQDQERLAATRGEVALYLIATYKAIGGGWEIRNGGTMTDGHADRSSPRAGGGPGGGRSRRPTEDSSGPGRDHDWIPTTERRKS